MFIICKAEMNSCYSGLDSNSPLQTTYKGWRVVVRQWELHVSCVSPRISQPSLETETLKSSKNTEMARPAKFGSNSTFVCTARDTWHKCNFEKIKNRLNNPMFCVFQMSWEMFPTWRQGVRVNYFTARSPNNRFFPRSCVTIETASIKKLTINN